MSILIDQETRLIVQGITGREGRFHTEQMLSYGTRVVAGVTPGKGGSDVLGVPVFNTVREAKEATDANATIIFVPAKFTKDSVLEAIDAGMKLIFTIAEHVPVHDMMFCYQIARARGVRLFGPNSFGVISPGKCKAGFMAHRMFSATNCYETVLMLSNNGIGQSTCVGNGGDMIPGSTFVDVLPDFQADPETKAIVIIGEIGGNEEELAAAYIKEHATKPVVAMIAGKNAPKDRSMGHAGAIVSADGTGSAQSKEAALQDAGAIIAQSTQHILEIMLELKSKGKI